MCLVKSFEIQYMQSLIDLVNKTETEVMQGDRTGVGTWKKSGQIFNIDLINEPLPILHGKKMNFKAAVIEMLWMMKGDTNTEYLKANGVNYWDDWANEYGDLGEIYGHQMRNFNGSDQLLELVSGLIKNFSGRRHLISLWNPSRLHAMALPPCHYAYQLVTYLGADGVKYADLVVTQRSGDSFLGIPYDFLIFTVWAEIIAKYVGFKLINMTIMVGDYHIYSNHIDAVKKYLSTLNSWGKDNYVKEYMRKPVELRPKMVIDYETNETPTMLGFKEYIDFLYLNPHLIRMSGDYNHGPFIKAPIAV